MIYLSRQGCENRASWIAKLEGSRNRWGLDQQTIHHIHYNAGGSEPILYTLNDNKDCVSFKGAVVSHLREVSDTFPQEQSVYYKITAEENLDNTVCWAPRPWIGFLDAWKVDKGSLNPPGSC